uniref:(northern house mosquito) hypothetical protein n=1 Tax=Culex pipiens TaxID=7175 RepID=A0A8D8F7Q8_CULPI
MWRSSLGPNVSSFVTVAGRIICCCRRETPKECPMICLSWFRTTKMTPSVKSLMRRTAMILTRIVEYGIGFIRIVERWAFRSIGLCRRTCFIWRTLRSSFPT